jgi:tRNA A-37 threonylcarbamoyl transferase component Bud32
VTPSTLGGRYVLLQELGRGATAVVYRAKDERLGTEVAVKVLAPHLVRDPAAAGRLERELQAARQITSEAVAQVYELGENAGTRYVVMEYGPSGTLKDHVLLHGPLKPALLDRLMEQVADALAACHARGILHRDLKPSNILFDAASGRMKLIDFGVARIADNSDAESVGSVVGTPEYMAPEQFEDAAPDPRSDLYAAGAVLYEAATGQPPVIGRSLPEVIRKHQEGLRRRPRDLNPGVGEGAEAIILRLLARDPGDRFQTAEELRRAVEGRVAPDPAEPLTEPSRGTSCPRCRGAREPGLPFCPMCGESLADFDRFGRWSVLVAGDPDRRALLDALALRLPGHVRRTEPTGRGRPLVALEFASEPLARWLAEELRGLEITASTRKAGLARTLGLGMVAGFALTLLAGWTLSGMAHLLRGTGAGVFSLLGVPVLAGGAFAFCRHVKSRFGRALAYVMPFPPPSRTVPSLERARLAQRRLTSHRHRAIGRELLVSAHRLREMGARDRARSRGRDEVLETGFALLEAMEIQSMALRERGQAPEKRAARQDALLRGTQALLRLTVLRRGEHAASARCAGRDLARSFGRFEASAAELTERHAELAQALQELSALAPAATRPRAS